MNRKWNEKFIHSNCSYIRKFINLTYIDYLNLNKVRYKFKKNIYINNSLFSKLLSSF